MYSCLSLFPHSFSISVYYYSDLDERPVELVTSLDEGSQVTDYCQLHTTNVYIRLPAQ